MADGRGRLVDHQAARPTQPKAQILVLLVQEQLLVESPDRHERRALNQHRRAGHPGHLLADVRLAASSCGPPSARSPLSARAAGRGRTAGLPLGGEQLGPGRLDPVNAGNRKQQTPGPCREAGTRRLDSGSGGRGPRSWRPEGCGRRRSPGWPAAECPAIWSHGGEIVEILARGVVEQVDLVLQRDCPPNPKPPSRCIVLGTDAFGSSRPGPRPWQSSIQPTISEGSRAPTPAMVRTR